MHLRVIAIGERQPAWVDAACADYRARLPRHWQFALRTLAASRRRRQSGADQARLDEGERICAELRPAERAVMLDEKGKELSSVELAAALQEWQIEGRDLCFVIGGPDGFSEACTARADFRWSLSRLTLPHGLARVLCIEQLYRASTLHDGHPYHRG
ncbi:MAG TPA: 23S rRNA (pseudouridine(1915)-N(3))-methyltransferase RlmH [Woeseiaceae bacterium]|nr:23S rRNA (pseudouridine(1915)-N(3))-methyltransferase RlmH [Woeseiaceae bacterium]